MPLIVLSTYLKDSMGDYFENNALLHVWITLACLLYLFGFWRFVHMRDIMIRKLTSRLAVIVSVVIAFVLLLICGLIDNPYVTVFMQLPIGFLLGMTIQFQR